MQTKFSVFSFQFSGLFILCLALCGCSARIGRAADLASFAPATVPTQTVHVIVSAAPAPAAAVASSGWGDTFQWVLAQPWAVAIEGSALGWLLLKLHVTNLQKFNDNASRWEDTIMHAFNDAEATGVLNKWAGKQKLDYALGVFDKQFRLVFGTAPTNQDIADATVQFASVAAKA